MYTVEYQYHSNRVPITINLSMKKSLKVKNFIWLYFFLTLYSILSEFNPNVIYYQKYFITFLCISAVKIYLYI